MSNEPSSFDALYEALLGLGDRRGGLPSMLSAQDVARETGLPVNVVVRAAAHARRMVVSLIQGEAEKVAEGRAVALEGDITLGLLELVDSRIVPGKFPQAIRTVAFLDAGEIEREYPRILAHTKALAESRRQQQEARDAYWSGRLNRQRKDLAGKGWRKFADERPPGKLPRLCVVFDEPYGFFEIAYWVGLTEQWWFLDSSSQIDVTHWCPVPTPPGGWPPVEAYRPGDDE